LSWCPDSYWRTLGHGGSKGKGIGLFGDCARVSWSSNAFRTVSTLTSGLVLSSANGCNPVMTLTLPKSIANLAKRLKIHSRKEYVPMKGWHTSLGGCIPQWESDSRKIENFLLGKGSASRIRMASQQQKLPIQNIWRSCSCAILSTAINVICFGRDGTTCMFGFVWIKLLASNAMRANAQFAYVIVILCAPKSKFVFIFELAA
jgi:hypothetical protein